MLLANRIKKVLNGLISKSQSSFLGQRKMYDGIMLLNELLDYCMRFKNKCLIMKIHYEKSYDNVSRDFLKFMQKTIEFGGTWIRWMEALIFF